MVSGIWDTRNMWDMLIFICGVPLLTLGRISRGPWEGKIFIGAPGQLQTLAVESERSRPIGAWGPPSGSRPRQTLAYRDREAGSFCADRGHEFVLPWWSPNARAPSRRGQGWSRGAGLYFQYSIDHYSWGIAMVWRTYVGTRYMGRREHVGYVKGAVRSTEYLYAEFHF